MNELSRLPSYKPRPPGAPSALDGVLVVDFTQFIAGPYATVILADFGAQVFKIENPDRGDDMRGLKMGELPGGDGGPFLWANRNKRSVVLDLSSPSGRTVALDLARRADVIVENFSAGVMQRFGLDYDSVAALNPGVIYCSISAAGRSGPLRERVAFDPITQAESGFVALNKGTSAPGRALTTPIIDLTTGMMAATAILAALAGRAQLGRGQKVEIAMLDQGVNLLSYHAFNYLITGVEPVEGPARTAGPIGIFDTSDSEIYICCANERTFGRFVVDGLGRPDLKADPQYATPSRRAENADAFLSIVAQALQKDTRDNWLSRLRACGVPVGPVASVSGALASSEVAERGLISKIPHPVAGLAPHVTPPFRMSLTPVVDPLVAPALGQDTRAVLEAVLGYSDGRIRDLTAAGAFGAGDTPSVPAGVNASAAGGRAGAVP